jgi:tetratricopeptide (TPR) repeat protein
LRLVLAVGFPVALLFLLEASLRLVGFGRPATFLIPDTAPGELRTNPDFARLFLPGNFDLRPLNFRVSEHKAPNAIRIVVLGESAAQGVPVPSFAFAPQLRAMLRSRYPGKEVEVLDTGIVAINSHVVYQIARDMARVEPDLFVVYMGNNEVVGPYGPGCAYLSQMPPLWVIRASVFVKSTRTGQLAVELLSRLSGVHRAPAEWGGMSMFVNNAVRGDDPRLPAVYANFEANLRGIVDAASGVGAKALLCTVVANLKDCPPFLSLHQPGLSDAHLAAWNSAFEGGRLAWRLGDPDAEAKLAEALTSDPQYADTHFMLGSLDLRRGDIDSARRHFVDALHWDALRFRPDPAINQVIRKVASERAKDVLLVDSALDLGADPGSSAPPSGRELLFEHVHFDWAGNYRMAREIAGGCEQVMGRGGSGAFPDSRACAGALGYTPHERLPMLLRIDVLVRKPPFTNQLSYIEDQARLAREIEEARAGAGSRADIKADGDLVLSDMKRDPDNPALPGIEEGICEDLGEPAEALEMATRAARLLPSDYAQAADRASLLIRLGRTEEAERELVDASRSGADLELLAPVFAELWTRTKRYQDGVKFVDAAILRDPGEFRLRLIRGDMLEESGDLPGAEKEFEGALEGHPSDSEFLEALVGVLSKEGKDAEVSKVSLAYADRQLTNQPNCLRASRACDELGDDVRSAGYLAAAERCGPVNATFELTLALKYYKQGRVAEMMDRLAEAKVLSLSEGNPAVTDSITRLIERMVREARPGS